MHLPTELWRVALAGKEPGTTTPLTIQNQALVAEVDFRPMEEAYVDSPSGKKIQVLLVKPHGFDPAKKYPVIVNVHGGPQMQWADAFRGDAQVYPGAGYVVAFPNPHGSTGWGQDFTAAISGDWDGKVMKDVRRRGGLARRAAVGRQGPDRGDGLVVGRLRDDVARRKRQPLQGARLDDGRLRPPVDVLDDRGALVPRVGPEGDSLAEPRGVREAEPVVVRSRSSGRRRSSITGQKDFRVPYTQSLAFFTDLQKMGVPSRLIVLENASHWPGWYDMVLYYAAHLDWFHKYLGGAPSPYDPKALVANDVFGKEKDGKKEEAKKDAPKEGASGRPAEQEPVRERAEEARAVGVPEHRLGGPLGVRHEADDVPLPVADARDVVEGAVRVRAGGARPRGVAVAEDDLVVRRHVVPGRGLGPPVPVAVRDREAQDVALRQLGGERRPDRLDADEDVLAAEALARVEEERARQEPRLAEDLEAVADAEDGARPSPRSRGRRP